MEINNSNMEKAHNELLEIFKKKNSDYGNSFEKSLQEHGIISAIVRMEDKMRRLTNLSKQTSNQKVDDESIIDTLKDLSNYALMTAIWLEPTELNAYTNKLEKKFNMSYFDGRGKKFKSVIQDIISFDTNMIITESITFNNMVQTDMISFDVNNIKKIVLWWITSKYSKKSNYTFIYNNNINDDKRGNIKIYIKEVESDVRIK